MRWEAQPRRRLTMGGRFEPLRVGVVGCEKVSRGYGDSLRTRPDLVQIAGAFDLDHERTKAFIERYGRRAYDCYDDPLDDDEVEAIVSLTVDHAHAEVSSAALEAGKQVHSEKPLATNRRDGRRLPLISWEGAGLPSVRPRHEGRGGDAFIYRVEVGE